MPQGNLKNIRVMWPQSVIKGEALCLEDMVKLVDNKGKKQTSMKEVDKANHKPGNKESHPPLEAEITH